MNKRIVQIIVFVLIAALRVNATDHPKLLIFISVDQMRADYLERFKNEFSGGLRLITQEGSVYRNAYLNYAPSETGPGHAALSTGCYPSKTGILSNEWLDPTTRKDVYCVEDTSAEKVGAEGGGVSPKNLKVTALGDWLKLASPDSKIIAVSVKDRAAILMGGQHPTYAFWYDRSSGDMVTSKYYTQEIPEWVKSFNARGWVTQNVPVAWTKLRPEEVYTNYGPDTVHGEFLWNGSTAFPHTFAIDKKKEQLLMSPFGDMMILDFARSAISNENLGQRQSVDLLCIGLSCTDYIGHAFGPNSQEMEDQILRLDQMLGSFLSDVERTIGHGNILLALSADHAVMPLPEYTVNVEHKTARRISPKKGINPGIQAIDRSLKEELGTSDHIIESNAFLNYVAAAKAGVDSTALENRVKEGLMKLDGIVDVYFKRELLDTTTPGRPYLDEFRRGYYPPRGEDFLIRFCENCLVSGSSTGTTHGTPYAYDTHVPLVFWGPGVKSMSVDRTVYTIDIAPTLAKVLNIRYPASIDGHPLPEVAQ